MSPAPHNLRHGRPRFELPGVPSYFGGKGGQVAVRRIINALPPHRVYIEPFLGSGRIFRTKQPAPLANIGVELLAPLAATWQQACPPGYSVTHGNALHLLPVLVAHWVRQCLVPEEVLVYVDPPYLLHTRRNPSATYAHEFDHEDHAALLASLQKLPCRVLVSHLPCAEYATALAQWHTFTFTNATRRGPQLEQVWCNFPPSVTLHEYTFIGDNKRHREQIRRHFSVILRRAAKLPPSARVALAAALVGLNSCDPS